MAELPEIKKLAGQMNQTLHGKKVDSLVVLQEKCLNHPLPLFVHRLTGASVERVYHKGKWIFIDLDNQENLLLSLGMGADILYYEPGKDLPEKYQINLGFTDGSGFTARFWWFGNLYLVSDDELPLEPRTKDIAMDPLDDRFTLEYFTALLGQRRTQIKTFLLDQKRVGGIGNMYMHDILFKAGIHPTRRVVDLSHEEIERLYQSIRELLLLSVSKGTFHYEMDFFGEKGGFGNDDFLIAYKPEGSLCPVCGTLIEQIKTGSTSSFVCPTCQK